MINRKSIANSLGLKTEELTVGFTASAADFLHPGFLTVLEEGSRLSDYFIVGLQTDPTIDRGKTKQKPFQSSFERWCQLYCCEYVDLIIPFDTEDDLLRLLQIIQPDIRLVGEEYEGSKHTGYDLPGIYYNKRKHDYSSTMWRNRMKNYLKENE